MTTAMQKFEMPTWATSALQPFLNNDSVELLLPAIPLTADVGRGFKVEASVVQLSADKDAGDVFKVGSKKVGSNWIDTYGYTKAALTKLAQQAGIQYDTQRIDDRRDPDVCAFKCHAIMRTASGEMVHCTASKEFRFTEYAEVRWQEMLAANTKADSRYKKSESDLREAWSAETLQMRKHMHAQTETKAMLRVIRAMLSIKGGLTAEQVAKPKVVLRFVPDTNDPDMRQALLQRGTDAGSVLYAPQRSESMAEVVNATRELMPPADEDEEREEAGNGVAGESKHSAAPGVASAAPPAQLPQEGIERRGFFATLDDAIARGLAIEPMEGGAPIRLQTVHRSNTDEGRAARRALLAELFGTPIDPKQMTPAQWIQARDQMKARAVVISAAQVQSTDLPQD